MSSLSDQQTADLIREVSPQVVDGINDFTRVVFKTRGGRMGSGMGLLLEGLWGYHTSRILEGEGIEISWIAEDQYNDYAVTETNRVWDPITREGELLRIEAKTMNLGADETKGHFAELQENITDNDLLLIMLWRWTILDSDGYYVAPQVLDVFLDRAKPLAELRDALHISRGGSFVEKGNCPDGCSPDRCSHHGEPLNSSGNRERISGPESRRPSQKNSHANNFGGLKRMIAAGSPQARAVKRNISSKDQVSAKYIDFMDASRVNSLKGLTY